MAVLMRTVIAFIQFATMVIFELVLAILIYVYLALYELETFGWLVKISKGVLDSAIQWMEVAMPQLANRAYATLVGELGPKAMLLLLTGLIVGALIRFIAWLVVATVRHRRG